MLVLLSLLLCAADLCLLAHEDYRVRDAAEARLKQQAYLSWRACDLLARTSTDLEVRRRAARVARYGHFLDRKPLPFFLVTDGKGKTDTWTTWSEYVLLADGKTGSELTSVRVPVRYRPVCGDGYDANGCYRAEKLRQRTEELARTALLLGVPRVALEWVLSWMQEREKAWR